MKRSRGAWSLGLLMLCACGSDNSNPSPDGSIADAAAPGACATDLVGTWGLSKLKDVPSVNSSNSTWTFKADGTYTWCLDVAQYKLDGSGTYKKVGASLEVTGDFLQVVGTSPVALLDCGADTFSFKDDEADGWTYQRDASATGCSAQ